MYRNSEKEKEKKDMYQLIYYMPKLKHIAVTCAVPTKNNKITSVTKIVDSRKARDDYNSNKINNF